MGPLRLICFVILIGSKCTAGADTGDKISIFVSIPPQKYLLDRIGGERVQVNVMLEPGQTPETYDPAPRQIALLSTARIYFRIGVPFERQWMDTIRGQNPELVRVDCCPDLMKGGDPHIWTSPGNARIIAAQMRDVLVEHDPGSASSYAQNYRILNADLDRLDRDIRALLADRRTDYFIVSHAGWGYYADQYGLKQMALDANGREKGPRGLAGLVVLARREGIGTVFIQAQHPSGAAYTLARELDARTVPIDNLAGNYIDNMYQVSRLIAESLR